MLEKEDECYFRTQCRLCDSSQLNCVISLTPTPPANGLLTDASIDLNEKSFPLDVYRCDACGHIQLLNILNKNMLFTHYLYVSRTSPVMVNHLKKQCDSTISRLKLKQGDLVVEIGSNDGTLLQFFKQAGMRVLGIDPAKNIAMEAQKNGIETITDFFSETLAGEIRKKHGSAAVICANNVFAHIDDLNNIACGIRALLALNGQFIFEVGYLVDVYQKTLFDTIYHEHVDFHRVAPLVKFFNKHNMSFISAERVDIQGGSLRGYVRLGSHKPDDSIFKLNDLEQSIGLDKADTFKTYESQIRYRKDELMSLLRGLKSNGKSIVGYGSPAKATTLMHHFGLDKNIIDFIVEDNSLKHGYFTPGFHVPILPIEALYQKKPDYVLVLAWNFSDPIIHKHKHYAGIDSRFIVPLPNLRLIGEYACG
jgi:SAM-dependent methyltransferase